MDYFDSAGYILFMILDSERSAEYIDFLTSTDKK